MKQEVRRGRKFVEYHDPDTQDANTFTQEISGADVSYQDEAGNWLPADENWQTDGLDGFILKNDKLNHKVRLKGAGGRTWYPRRNVNTEYMTFGVPQYRNGNKWSNFRFSGWSVDGKTVTLNTRQGVTILVHNFWNGIKIDWVLASSSAPSRMRYPVSLTGITYVDGIIYGADGTRLGQLTPTTATDSTFDEDGMPTQLPCSGSYSGGYVEFQADVTGASFPVTIDPDFGSGDGGDTCLYNSWNYGAAQTTNYTSADLYRFILSSIPSSAICTAVDFKVVHASNTGNSQSQSYSIYGITAANGDWIAGTKAGAAAGIGEPNDIYKKYNTVTWAGSAKLGTANTDYITPAYGAATVNRADDLGTVYTLSFNAAGIAKVQTWFGESTNDGLVGKCSSWNNPYFGLSENATESYRPVLSVTYTAGATGALRRTNMNAQMSNLTGGIHG